MEEIFAEQFASMVRRLKVDADLIPDYKLQSEDGAYVVDEYSGADFIRTWITDEQRTVLLTCWDDHSVWYEAELHEPPLPAAALWIDGDGREIQYELSVGGNRIPVTAEIKAKIRQLFIPKEQIL